MPLRDFTPIKRLRGNEKLTLEILLLIISLKNPCWWKLKKLGRKGESMCTIWPINSYKTERRKNSPCVSWYNLRILSLLELNRKLGPERYVKDIILTMWSCNKSLEISLRTQAQRFRSSKLMFSGKYQIFCKKNMIGYF